MPAYGVRPLAEIEFADYMYPGFAGRFRPLSHASHHSQASTTAGAPAPTDARVSAVVTEATTFGSSNPRLTLRIDQNGPTRRARHLHVMVVPAEVVRHVVVV